MPPKKSSKRQKGTSAAVAAPAQPSPPAKSVDTGRPTPAEVEEEEHPFVQLARKHWLKSGKKSAAVKVKNDVVKQGMWDVLEREGFQYKSMRLLESLQTLEGYLWPGYTENATNHHVLLIALIINVKRREHLETWNLFENRPDEFSSMFRRIISLMIDRSLAIAVRTQLLSFLIHAFQSLDVTIIRKECAPLVSIGVWHNLSNENVRETLLSQHGHLKKAWRAASKRYEAADDATKARLRFERSWLYSLLLDFLTRLFGPQESGDLVYCERFTEFMSDLQSQLPTRRYVNTLLWDLHLVPVVKLSPMYQEDANSLLRELHALLAHYTYFTVDDHTGAQLSSAEAYDKHCERLNQLQFVALKHFKDKLTVLALSNFGSIDRREDLEPLLQSLDDEEILQLMSHLNLRSSYPESLSLPTDRKFLIEIMLSYFERRKSFQETTEGMVLVPTEQALFDESFQHAENYDGSQPLALPKLNLQYLSVGDFLWRALILYRREAFYGIRKDIDSALRRLKPEPGASGETRFSGFSKMAMPSSKPSILEVVPPLVGEDQPSEVRAEVSIDVRKLGESVRREWDSLRVDDVVFLLGIEPPPSETLANGGGVLPEHEKLGITSVRTAVIRQITDDKGRMVRDGSHGLDNKRRIQLKLDPRTYTRDTEAAAAGRPDVYGRVNIIMRRGRRENNFKPVLESIRSLVLSEVPLPSWLHDIFLGYGDPAGAHHKNLPNRIKRVDYRDSFLDWHHLIESLPGKTVEPDDDVEGSFPPPYVLESADKKEEAALEKKPSKKRRRDAEPVSKEEVEAFKVSTYKPPNRGPYPVDAPRLNSVRFTPSQTDAIMSGSQPGLTVIVGPPGTGKTDVATQVINNIYHNFPDQKTLLVAHSNQALNQLFAKITALDIDERHLLRLGHGEEELMTESNFSKHGRVESFLQNRDVYLQEVRKLAASLGAPGAHDNSSETAGYFNTVYVEPAWIKFLQVADGNETSAAETVQAFPFHGYFADAPQPLFPPEAEKAQVLDIAHGCHRHIMKIFTELADALPFELLRRERDKANYLLTNEARIIAMTTTHAAIRRGEIASLGFHYDNIVMEEAAQITEVETFIPLAMQKPVNGELNLQRVVLCGDHYQNSPVIQSLAFRHYANMEQSLFSRLVRLGVPTVMLDQQGRARPDIAKLYQWRYPKLDNLPDVQHREEFLRANAGFKHDFQFIDVPDYKGKGEAEPTPHFIQNLGEAEYAVAIFQYMRLLGYPAEKITILTTYAGQRALIRDVLGHRCAKNPVFGLPKAVATVDKYQGEQNDYVILSLTRTSRVGYLRDVRRMTVAVSRARLGLYILGRRSVFEACPELRPAFDMLLERPDKLALVTGELWPSQRLIADEKDANGSVQGEVTMESVEHLGQYVFEMTNTRIKQLQAEQGVPAEPTIYEEDDGDQGDQEGYVDRGDGDEEVEPDIQEVREGNDG